MCDCSKGFSLHGGDWRTNPRPLAPSGEEDTGNAMRSALRYSAAHLYVCAATHVDTHQCDARLSAGVAASAACRGAVCGRPADSTPSGHSLEHATTCSVMCCALVCCRFHGWPAAETPCTIKSCLPCAPHNGSKHGLYTSSFMVHDALICTSCAYCMRPSCSYCTAWLYAQLCICMLIETINILHVVC